jgi:hypothetical protein
MGIVEISAIVSAVVVIAGTCWKTFSMCHNILNRLEDFSESNKRNEMHIMKLALFNEGLPLVDRIQCGQRYLELGGNGTGKIQYEILKERMENQLESKKIYDNTDVF